MFLTTRFTCLFFCGGVFAQFDPPHSLAYRAETSAALLDDTRELCDRVGGRPTGSPACDRAVDWAARKFRDAGIQKVSVEPFTIPLLWLPGTAEASATAPEKWPLRIAAAPMSPSTKGAIEAKLVDVGDGSPQEFAKVAGSLKGAIALVRSNEMKTFDDLFAEYLKNPGLRESSQKYGLAALLLESTRPRLLLYRHPISLTNDLAPVPTALVSREHAERLARLAQNSEVRVRLSIANKIGGPYQSRNVIAEIPGREKPEEIVLLGAHLDSWDLGTGAEDNGINAAMGIDTARAFQQLGVKPRRTVRFALFTGEEQGMLGSEAYVAQHKAELDNHVAAVVFDIGSGHTSGFYLNGREDLRKPVNSTLDAVGGLGATEQVLDAIDGTDNLDFALSGVPNLVAVQDPAPYLPNYHAESDTFDRINATEAKHNEAIAAVLVWGLAEAPERPAKRQSRAEIERLLTDTKLDEQMKLFGQWDDFKSGKRGFSK
jgi:carboxypeptidase Q